MFARVNLNGQSRVLRLIVRKYTEGAQTAVLIHDEIGRRIGSLTQLVPFFQPGLDEIVLNPTDPIAECFSQLLESMPAVFKDTDRKVGVQNKLAAIWKFHPEAYEPAVGDGDLLRVDNSEAGIDIRRSLVQPAVDQIEQFAVKMMSNDFAVAMMTANSMNSETHQMTSEQVEGLMQIRRDLLERLNMISAMLRGQIFLNAETGEISSTQAMENFVAGLSQDQIEAKMAQTEGWVGITHSGPVRIEVKDEREADTPTAENEKPGFDLWRRCQGLWSAARGQLRRTGS